MITLIFRIALLMGVLCTFYLPLTLSAQKNDYFWAFSRNKVIYFSDSSLTLDSLPVAVWASSECAASIADNQGKPRFYLDPELEYWWGGDTKSSIRNAEGKIIENGDSILTNMSISQALLLPVPPTYEQYMFFGLYNKFIRKYNFDSTSSSYLAYSLIDGKANNGKGKVIQKNVLLNHPEPLSEKICAVKHANGTDWWIAVKAYYGENYYLHLLTPKGIEKTTVQKVGRKVQPIPESHLYAGTMSFAPTGDKLIACMYDTSEVFSFDRCSGLLQPFAYLPGTYDGSFSPNGKLFYQTKGYPNVKKIYRYDLSDTFNIQQETFIGDIKPHYSQIQLGPDNKLYISLDEGLYLSVIHKPDELNCEFQEDAIFIGETSRRLSNGVGLPNMPNYRLGAMSCSTNARPKDTKKYFMELYPNPATESITLRYRTNENFTLSVCTVTGMEVMRLNMNEKGEKTIDISSLSEGMYIVKAQGNTGILFTEKLIIIR